MSGKVFEAYFREIYSDLSVTAEESDAIKDKLEESNIPPDKLVWLRSSAFRIGCQYLSDDTDSNINLLKCINRVVHAIEDTCMEPTVEAENESFSEEAVEELYRTLFTDLVVDSEENQELFDYFRGDNRPPEDKLIWTRASAFRMGVEFLGEDRDTNVSLMKCINSIVHALEMTCMKPKPYELKADIPEDMSDMSLAEALQTLWDLDLNRLTPGEDYQINVQEGKKAYWKEDKAEDPLFTFVDNSAFRRPTYKAFIALLDNYTAETGVREAVTYEERKENWSFLKAIMESGPMQFCHKYCMSKNPDITSDRDEFMKMLNNMWFGIYRRGGSGGDSSGFEHVFAGELKNGQVSGFHNWVYYYLEEKKGNVDYRGYIYPRSYSDAETNANDHVLTLQFEWQGVLKNVGTSFIGVSPEFEMALYTMCFFAGEKENIFDLDTGSDVFKLNCKVYTMGRDKIGTSYVETMGHED